MSLSASRLDLPHLETLLRVVGEVQVPLLLLRDDVLHLDLRLALLAGASVGRRRDRAKMSVAVDVVQAGSLTLLVQVRLNGSLLHESSLGSRGTLAGWHGGF